MAQNTATFKIWRTHPEGDGTYQTFHTEVSDGMVVLDVVHKIQAEQAPDLAVRWNCKAWWMDARDGMLWMAQRDIDRVHEFRKCIERYLCQDVCHVMRELGKHDEYIGPLYLVYAGNLKMNPIDTEDRITALKEQHG